MLSAGERPQPPVTPAIVKPPSNGSVSKAHIVPVESSPGSSSTLSAILPDKPIKPMPVQHIWVVTGPAGCGKSTVGEGLRRELGLPFLEGDDVRESTQFIRLRKGDIQGSNTQAVAQQYHSRSNKDKMGNGIALTDEDRWDWLISLRKAAIDALSPSESNNFQPPAGVIVACSALKQKYRDVMRVAAYGSPSVRIYFIYLKLSEEVLMQRLKQREAHYMKSGMVRSQLQVLEEPQGEWDAITINVEGRPGEVEEHVLNAVNAKLSEKP